MPVHDERDVRELILAAFNQARESGKLDWSQMTIAVLKNRILSLTNGTFRESDYGANSFGELLNSQTNMLSIEWNGKVAVANLIESVEKLRLPTEQSGMISGPPNRDNRILPDLWRAIVNFSSDVPYIWHEGCAVQTSEPTTSQDVLPTLTAAELRHWRQEFADSVLGNASTEDSERIVRWVDNPDSTSSLPSRSRKDWNAMLKHRIWDRLNEWFSSRDDLPRDLLQLIAPRRDQFETNIDHRQFLIRLISQMSAEELNQVQIPASVMFRILRS
jgi:hypothetical protein